MGSIFRRGRIYWIKYYRNGKPYRESTHGEALEGAKRLLKRREGEISKGEIPGIYFDKIRFEELAEDFLTDYRVNGKRSLDKAERCVRKLKEAFEGMRVTEITTARIKAYIERRMEQDFSNASINRELAALKRMFSLGAQCTPPKVNRIPHMPMLRENNIRKGFFEHEEFLALREALPDYLEPVVTFAYHTGWRKREIVSLTWDKVDLKQGTVRLDPGETKNNEGRTLYMNEELWREMKALHARRRLGCPYVFQWQGRQIKDFRGAWDAACEQVRLKGRLFHDFRRTAIRNMVRAGIPERVAMSLSGHKTRSIFDRYNIVSDEDLREAARRQQAYHERAQFGHNLGTVGKKMASFAERPIGPIY